MSRANVYTKGARWVRTRNQPGVSHPPVERKVVASNNTLGIFIGDFLDETTAGVVYPMTTGGGATPAAAYVCVGIERYRDATDNVMRKGSHLPATTTYTGSASLENPFATVLLCIPVTNQIFAVTVPTAVADIATAQALLNKCIDITAGAGSTVSGVSGHVTASSTAGTTDAWQATTTSAQLQLVEIPQGGTSGLNDVTQANWTGHFLAYETRGII